MDWSREEITRRLFREDPPARGDAAVVFGAAEAEPRRARVERGVALHRAGLVPRLVLTGGGTAAGSGPEAAEMRAQARAAGVSDRDLLVEDRSVNTFENARFTAALLREAGLLEPPPTLLLVSSPWHLGRVVRTMRAAVPAGTRLLAVPCADPCARDAWTGSECCRRIVEAEAMILRAFLDAGLLPEE